MSALKISSLFLSFLLTFKLSAKDIACQQYLSETSRPFKKEVSKLLKNDKYFNLPLSEFKNTARYKYLVFRVSVSKDSAKSHKLFFVLQDDLSHNYWTQLNHVVEVQQGDYDIYVDLKQIVGERGSHVSPRTLDISRLKKAYLVLDPDHSEKYSLKVSHFRFFTPMRPEFSDQIKVFDFRIKNGKVLPCVSPIDEKDRYSKAKGYGFKKLNLWRKEDSQYLDPFLSSVLYANNGEFIVDLKNGKYEITLFWNSLGYWNIPFYTERKITIEGIPLRIQDRSKLSEYERDYFIFQDRIPTIEDHPWQWLYESVMRPITKTIVIQDGSMNFKFSGDTSAVALNGLIIAPVNTGIEKKKKNKFIKEFKNYLKGQYDRKIRAAFKGNSTWKSSSAIFRLTQASTALNPFLDLTTIKSNVSQVVFAAKESTFLNLQIQSPFKGQLKVKWQSELKDSPISLEVSKGTYQWVSLDRNHESYTLETQYLQKNHLGVQKYMNQQFLIEVRAHSLITKDQVFKEKGNLVVEILGEKDMKAKWSFPLEILLLNRDLPRQKIQVGFIGLNALKYSYFPAPDKLAQRRRWDRDYLALMAKYGFNAFSGLPTNYQSPQGLSFDEVAKLLKYAQKLGFNPPYYSYSGEFLHKFFEENSLVEINKKKPLLNRYLLHAPFKDIIFQFSDEAGGYSNNVERDLKRATFLKDNFPTLKLGGFSHWGDSEHGKLIELNKKFDQISLSEVGVLARTWLAKNKVPWGRYNQAQGARDDIYHILGRSLWSWSHHKGFSSYFEWHTCAIANLPYFDLDGREADVAIALPDSHGHLRPTLKFLRAAEGLQDYRWLLYLSTRKKIKLKDLFKYKEKFTFRKHILDYLK